MDNPRISIRGLQVFDAVITSGSLASAAEILNLSQSAASRQLLELEAVLKLNLFHRTRRHLVPSDAGMQFHSETQHLLSGIREIPAIVENIKTTARDSLSLIAMPRLTAGIVAPAMSRFRESHPNTKISLNMLRRFDIQRWASTRDFDLGLGTLPLAHRALQATPLFDVRAAVLLPSDHRLAKRSEINIEDLSEDTIINYLPGLTARDQMDDLMRSSGIPIETGFEVSSALTAFQMVLEGAGIAVLDALAVSPKTLDMGLRLVPLRPTRWWPIGSFKLGTGKLKAAAQAFLDNAHETVSETARIPEFEGLIRDHTSSD